MTNNICSAIDCTYNDPSNGCQRFQVASACPLRQQFPSKIDAPPACSQYWLYGQLSRREVIEAREWLEIWLKGDEKYKADIAARYRGWPVDYPKRELT
jgi:hypothetical protein